MIMIKGLILGLVAQAVVAVGFTLIGSVKGIKSDLFKTMLILCTGGVIAAVATFYLQASGHSQLVALSGSDILFLILGSILILVVGEFLYIAGLSASNLTTMSFTVLAYPIAALALDLMLRRITLSSFTVRDILGIGLSVIGFILLVKKEV